MRTPKEEVDALFKILAELNDGFETTFIENMQERFEDDDNPYMSEKQLACLEKLATQYLDKDKPTDVPSKNTEKYKTIEAAKQGVGDKNKNRAKQLEALTNYQLLTDIELYISVLKVRIKK